MLMREGRIGGGLRRFEVADNILRSASEDAVMADGPFGYIMTTSGSHLSGRYCS